MVQIRYSQLYTQPFNASFGNLENLITPELIDLCQDAKYIVIYGHTKSGKSLLAKELSRKLNDREYIFSDWFQHLGFKDAMYYILKEIQFNDKQLIIEGIQMSRLLRKGLQMNNFYPEVVIHIECDYETVKYAYIRDGEKDKLRQDGRFIKHWNGMIDKIFYEWYLNLQYVQIEKQPTIIKINTSIFN